MILAAAVRFSGRGLHRGRASSVVVAPARAGSGTRVRLGGRERTIGELAARGGARATTLVDPASGEALSGVEHLMAALAGLGLWDVLIVPEGDEVPVLDGSAGPFARALAASAAPSPPAGHLELAGVVRVGGERASIEARPARQLAIDVEIAFDHPAVGRQTFRWEPLRGDFITQLAPARTFGFLEEARALRARGLAAGAGLDCAVVFGPGGALNPEGLRFADEPVRHKTLDLVGDLALLGGPLRASVRASRPSHELNHELVRAVRAALENG
jgi:UDP-3-O-[3-hydroxymyristoyl] N-acetylglucosamine deacetylase